MHKFIKLADGTEIVYSDVELVDGEAQVKVYIEKPVHLGFQSVWCILPKCQWKDNDGFSEAEMESLKEIVEAVSRIILHRAGVNDGNSNGKQLLQPRICNVQTKFPYILVLSYETGEIREFDVSPYIKGPWFSELKNQTYFQTVRLLPGGIGIEWQNGQDIAPHELYENSLLVQA